eukprot:4594150-Pyramimonas_sp.AAC.1
MGAGADHAYVVDEQPSPLQRALRQCRTEVSRRPPSHPRAWRRECRRRGAWCPPEQLRHDGLECGYLEAHANRSSQIFEQLLSHSQEN